MTTVFITGSTGFIGQAVIHQLLKYLGTEDKLYMLVRKPVESADKRVVPVLGDLESVDSVYDLVVKADYIIHIAGEARLCGGSDYERTNVTATGQLLAIAKSSTSLKRFIYISSIAAMDRSPSDRCNEPITVASACFPRTAYGKSKRRAEELILQSELPYTIFRPGFVYGTGMRNDSHLKKFALLIRKGVPLHRLGFPGRISLIHVDDLAVAIANCLKSDLGVDRTYLAETEFMTLGDVLSLLGESLYGHPLSQVTVPAFKSVFQRIHSKLPVVVAGMFIDYFWMNDPTFREKFIDDSQQRSFRDNVHDIIQDLLVKSAKDCPKP